MKKLEDAKIAKREACKKRLENQRKIQAKIQQSQSINIDFERQLKKLATKGGMAQKPYCCWSCTHVCYQSLPSSMQLPVRNEMAQTLHKFLQQNWVLHIRKTTILSYQMFPVLLPQIPSFMDIGSNTMQANPKVNEEG